MGNVEWSMLNIELRMTKEIAMKKSRCSVLFAVGLLAVAGLFGCSQETPMEKTKAAAASGNAATQAAGQAAVDAIKTPMDKARQMESTLEKSAEQTAAKIKRSRRSSRHDGCAGENGSKKVSALFELTAVSFVRHMLTPLSLRSSNETRERSTHVHISHTSATG